MVIKICNDIIDITEDEQLNAKNYIDALPYIRNVHIFISTISKYINIEDIKFLPSFKGITVLRETDISSVCKKEQKMEVFRMMTKKPTDDQSILFKLKNHLLNSICESAVVNNKILTCNIDAIKVNNA